MAGRQATAVYVLHLVDLFFRPGRCLPITKISDYDGDGGGNFDILNINKKAGLNLVEGDIVLNAKQTRNSVIWNEYRWPKTVPYYMEEDLEINAKGVILKTFEQFRLKTCIDFKPWSGEANYISIFKGDGCFSFIGNQRIGKQILSIGTYCDSIGIVEHQFLHALGFWHEHSRADRDDYVKIMWDDISAGKEHNFNSYTDTTSSSLGVPYDYNSIMHYSKTTFSRGSESTIVTKIPAFSDVIGQSMEFSDSDLLKLHRLYNCTQASTFLDSCDFESENICGMIQGPEAKVDWVRVATAAGGPDTDYSNMGRCAGSGYFMHFNTGAASTGDTALLQSRLLYPTRGFQCLEFFYYNSAGPADSLKIYVREYDSANPNGTLRFIKAVDGSPQDLWQLHHVSLDVKKKFRVVFQGSKEGAGLATGGLSLDDINLSETTCPEFIWRVKNFSHVLETTPTNTSMFSPPFTSKEGYTFQMSLYPNGTEGNAGQLSAFAHLVAREGDTGQIWPCPWKQITMMLMDQHPHIQKRMSNQRSVTTDPNMKIQGSDLYYWDDPCKVGEEVTDTDGSRYFRGPGYGTSAYLTQLRAKSRDFIKGGDAIFLLTMEDVSHLTVKQPWIFPTTTTTRKPTTTTTSRKPTTTTTTRKPTTTTSTKAATPTSSLQPFSSSICVSLLCLNGGVCVKANGTAACRCAVGEDWWYYGHRCEKQASQSIIDTITIISILSIAGETVVVTLVLFCMNRVYKKRTEQAVISSQAFPYHYRQY